MYKKHKYNNSNSKIYMSHETETVIKYILADSSMHDEIEYLDLSDWQYYFMVKKAAPQSFYDKLQHETYLAVADWSLIRNYVKKVIKNEREYKQSVLERNEKQQVYEDDSLSVEQINRINTIMKDKENENRRRRIDRDSMTSKEFYKKYNLNEYE